MNRIVLLSCVLFSCWAPAQQAPPASTPAPPSAQGSTMTQKPPRQSMPSMHAQHMQEMRAFTDKMTVNLEKMKAAVADMDAKDKPAMDANIAMWQSFIDMHKEMMQHMDHMGEDMMHPHPMGMHHAPPPDNSKPSAQPPKQ